MPDEKNELVISSAGQLLQPATRRGFLRMMGVGGAVVLLPSVFTACGSSDKSTTAPQPGNGSMAGTGATVTLNFSDANDLGVLNYAYALEQLEAAFYTAVVGASAFSTTFSNATERTMLTDIRNHEVIHRDFFKAALGSKAIGALNVSSAFTSLNLNDRTTVLTTARTFEDLGVSAYNGAAQYIKNVANLGIAGKIVSVEARHASAIRDVLQNDGASFAPRSFDLATSPADVATSAQAFIVQKLAFSPALPTFVQGAAPNT